MRGRWNEPWSWSSPTASSAAWSARSSRGWSARASRLARLELRTISRDTAGRHYAEHDGKAFFAELVDFITSGPLVAIVAEGPDAVKAVRQLAGATNPLEAVPGSIRGDFATVIGENIIHGSDSTGSADREIGIFFPDEE